MSFFHYLLLLLFLVVNGCIPTPAAPNNPQVKYDSIQQTSSSQSSQALSQAELQYQIMGFADNYAQMVGTAAVLFEERLPTPQARLQAKRAKVYSISAAFDIAAGPSPEAALLDMAALASLNRIVWDEHWRQNVFGAPADVMVEAYQTLENHIYSIIRQVLSAEQQQQFQDLIALWRQENPEQIGVNFIRFNDFANLRGQSQSKDSSSGGLLATVVEATRAVDDTLLLAERAKFLLTRMQLLVGFQTELVFMELVSEPEIGELQKDIRQFSQLAKWVEEEFPATLAEEREAAISQLRGELGEERDLAIKQLLDEVTVERSAAIKQLVTEVGNEREAAITQAFSEFSKEREAAITQFMREFSEERKQTIAQAIDSLSQERVGLEQQMIAAQNHGFMLAILLLVLSMVGIVFAVLIYKILLKKWVESKDSS